MITVTVFWFIKRKYQLARIECSKYDFSWDHSPFNERSFKTQQQLYLSILLWNRSTLIDTTQCYSDNNLQQSATTSDWLADWSNANRWITKRHFCRPSIVHRPSSYFVNLFRRRTTTMNRFLLVQNCPVCRSSVISLVVKNNYSTSYQYVLWLSLNIISRYSTMMHDPVIRGCLFQHKYTKTETYDIFIQSHKTKTGDKIVVLPDYWWNFKIKIELLFLYSSC